MNANLEDKCIATCLYAAKCNPRKLLATISPEEIIEIDVNSVWSKCQRIFLDERIKKKERLKFAMTIAKGAMIIRGEKLNLMHKRLNTFMTKMEHIDIKLSIENEDCEGAKVDISKLLEVPDIDLKFPDTPADRHLLSETQEELMLVHIGKDSDVSGDETLSQNMLSFEEFCRKQRAQQQVPEGIHDQGEKSREEEHQVPEGIYDQGDKNQERHQVPQKKEQEFQKAESQKASQREQILSSVEQAPEKGTHLESNMEVEDNAPVDSEFPSVDQVPGTPSKRPGSIIRGDDTPSKRRRFLSSVLAKERELENEGLNQSDIPGNQVAGVSGRERSPESERDQNVPGSPCYPRRRPLDFGERTTLTEKWFVDIPKRTESYMRPSVINDLRAERQTQPLEWKNLLKVPGFTIRDEKLQELFEQNFKDAEPRDEYEDISPEDSPQGAERDDPVNEEADQEKSFPDNQEKSFLDNQEQVSEQLRPQPEESNLMEPEQIGEQVDNTNKTDDSGKSMARISIPPPALADVTVTTSPKLPHVSIEDISARGMQDTFADDLTRVQRFQQDNSAVQGAAGPADENDQDQFPGTTEQTISAPARESFESDMRRMGITEETILAMILDRLSLHHVELIDLEEIIPPELHNKETSAWSYLCVLELKKKKIIELSQDGSNEPIYVSRYVRK